MKDDFKVKELSLFAGGILFGTAGIKVLASKDAKKLYTNCVAAALRAKDFVMKTATKVQENAEDVLAEAKQINDERATAEAACEQADACCCGAESAEAGVEESKADGEEA